MDLENYTAAQSLQDSCERWLAAPHAKLSGKTNAERKVNDLKNHERALRCYAAAAGGGETELEKLPGSGSTPNGLTVIANEETVQADKVHVVRFGKGECFADQTSKALSKGVVEALNMSRKAGAFANALVLSVR